MGARDGYGGVNGEYVVMMRLIWMMRLSIDRHR